MDCPEATPVPAPKPAEKKPFAWQPLTPIGLVRFTSASLSRLWLVQLVFALFSASCIVWSIYQAWVPVISAAVAQLPLQAEIRHGKMNWTGASPQGLAENRFLSLSIDLRHEGQARSPAHLQVEFGEKTVKFISLVGYAELAYPAQWWLALGRADAQPWWDAWRPAFLAIVGGCIVVSLIVCWAILATLYFLPARVAAFFADRELNVSQSWRLSGAAQLPGALFLTFTIILYALAWLDLPLLGLGVALHFLIGWIYLGCAIFRLPRAQGKESTKTNPVAAKH